MSDIIQLNGSILLYPTRIVIEGYYEQNKSLERSLSVWNDVTFSYDFQAFISDKENNKIILPSGTDLNYLNYLYKYQIIDKRDEIEKMLNNMKTPYQINLKYDCKDDIQKSAMEYLNKTYKRKRYMQRFLCLKTGQGKTYCTVRYISLNREKPIIFVDQDTLGKQWKERIQEYTDTTEKEIYYISGQKSINKILKMTEEEIDSIKFFICCYRTITNRLNQDNSDNILEKLFKKAKITLKVFDEAHIEIKTMFKIDMNTDVRAIYLSATPFRTERLEDKVYQNIFKNVEKFFYKEKNKNKEDLDDNTEYHNIFISNWNSNPSSKDQFDCATKYGFSMAHYCKYLQNTAYDIFEEKLYKLIFEFILANRKKRKIAITFGTNSLLDKFYDNLVQYVNTQGYKLKIGKVNGTIKSDKRISILEESDIIITTDKFFGKAIDVSGLQVLINTVPMSSEVKLTQLIGRLRRLPKKEVFFFDFTDNGFDAINNQLKSKTSKVYKKLGKNIYNQTL